MTAWIRKADRASETSICFWTARPPGGTIAAFDFTERRQVPNGSSHIRLLRQTVCAEGGTMTVHGTFVWTGRALQAGFQQTEGGLALLYPALAWSVCAPGHHGYPRAPDLIFGKALRG